ncbi:hypothetical protein [Cytobacillus kochii]|uniref:hypothetical protein n=1 Tax=Cytobacillus kochii TaxID=859143 RepID=UPI0024817990|nr:hypothetical protein [Cytobacillus kochii]
MNQYSFSFTPGLINEYKKVIAPNKGKKIFRNYLLNEYKLPTDLYVLQQKISNPDIQAYWMTEAEINKLNSFVEEALIRGFKVSKSAIMRNIIQNLIELYKNNPIKQGEQKQQIFHIPAGTKSRLNKFFDEGNLTFELSNFIMNDYIPSNEFPSARKIELELIHIKTDIEVFEELDEIANDYGFKRGGRAKIFRDALVQFEKKLLRDN